MTIIYASKIDSSGLIEAAKLLYQLPFYHCPCKQNCCSYPKLNKGGNK